MITITIDDRNLRARLDGMTNKIHDQLLRTINALVQEVRSYVITDKLSGQVLNFKTHHLQQSIQTDVDDAGSAITGKVYNSKAIAPYGAIHEFGGTTPAHDILPVKAQALHFMIGGKEIFAKIVHHPGSKMPERSYLRSSLKDKTDRIRSELTKAVVKGAQ